MCNSFNSQNPFGYLISAEPGAIFFMPLFHFHKNYGPTFSMNDQWRRMDDRRSSIFPSIHASFHWALPDFCIKQPYLLTLHRFRRQCSLFVISSPCMYLLQSFAWRCFALRNMQSVISRHGESVVQRRHSTKYTQYSVCWWKAYETCAHR
jgi:hypothetical protein